MTVVGIDLGTTNTVIAAVRDGRAAALKDKLGRALLPSVVSFSPQGPPKVGYEAKARRTIDPDNTVFSVKRLIGRTFDSEPVQSAMSRLPFTIKEGPGNSTLVSCHGKDYSLPELSSFVLAQAQKIAEARLGASATDAVITVPANFNDLQRAATKLAGKTAGLDVLRIINEPTAAALAYGFGKKGRERIAIYDFGGGTFDVTLLDLSENVFEVLATAGDTFLGGDDIDRAIMHRMAEQLLKTQSVDATTDNLAREQLRAAAEKLKVELSTRSMAKVKVEELDFEFTMRRSEFEKLAEPMLARTLSVCQEAMEIGGVDKGEVDQILLVGGSTRIPLVRRRISSFFGKMPQSRINPDEVVAIGAAIQASSLEAKKGTASIPAAPRPRAAEKSHPPSRAPNPLPAPKSTGTTQSGLSALKKTLPGGTIASSSMRTSPSVLTALSPAPRVAGTRPPTLKRSLPHERSEEISQEAADAHFSGKTLSGVGDAALVHGTTNLGLGEPSNPPPDFERLAPPSATGADFPAAMAEPLSLENKVASADTSLFDAFDSGGDDEVTQLVEGGTSADSPSADFSEIDDLCDIDSVADGSVTFDLADLEDQEAPDSVSNEATRIVDQLQADKQAFSLDKQVAKDDFDLPSPARVKPTKAEEHHPEAGLPALRKPLDLSATQAGSASPQANLPAALRRPARTKATTDLPATVDPRELGLAVARMSSPQKQKEEVGLPSARSPTDSRTLAGGNDLPAPAGNLPAPAGNLPAPAGNLPAPAGNLPAPAGNLPELLVGDADAGSAMKQSGERGPDFSSVSHGSIPAPPLNELDELSVSAVLSNDDNLSSPILNLSLEASSLHLGSSLSRISNTAQESHQTSPLHNGGPSVASDQSVADAAGSVLVVGAAGAPLLLDVTPLSLGVEVIGGYANRLIERNSPIPCEETRTFATAQDNQTLVRVRVSQGEEERFEENTVLGEVELTGLSQGPRGSVKVDVSFSLDESGMLQVTARNLATGNEVEARLMLAGIGHA